MHLFTPVRPARAPVTLMVGAARHITVLMLLAAAGPGSTTEIVTAATAVTAMPAAPAAIPSTTITIATGATSGIYFKAGQSICRYYLQDRGGKNAGRADVRDEGKSEIKSELRPDCKPLATAGSVSNLGLLRKSSHAIAIVQSDVQFQAYAGRGSFTGHQRFEDLRSLFSLHPETVAIAVAPDADIDAIEDLSGKRFGHGSTGSGSRLAAERLISALGWPRGRFAMLSPAAPNEAGRQLCTGMLDAFLVVVGHPADTLREPIERCGARLLPVSGPAIDRLLQDNRYLVRSNIPGGLYPGHIQPLPSYGPLAVVVTTARAPVNVVYHLVRGLFENLTDLRRENRAFADLSFRDMVSAGMTAPLHEGAIRYYRERGWIQ